MLIRRIIYISALTGAVCFYALYPFWFSGYLLAVLLLLTPFDLITGLPGMVTRRVALSAPNMLEQGMDGTLTVTTLQGRQFPVRCIKLRLRISGDGFSSKRRITCGAGKGSHFEMPIDTSHSGVITFGLKYIWTVSMIGLFSLPVRVNRKASVLVMPAPVKPPHVAALPRGVVFIPKPGGGFSEDYDLRPYRDGDLVRGIHWKVSAKVDALIIKEPLVPPPHSRLVETLQWKAPRERDLILGRLRWISDYLLKWDMPYYLKIGDIGPIVEIDNAADLTGYIYHILSGTSSTLPACTILPNRFAWVFRVDAREPGDEPEVKPDVRPFVQPGFQMEGTA